MADVYNASGVRVVLATSNIANLNLSAGTTSNNLTAVTFSNSNGISFGLDAGTVTAQHNALTTAMASNRASDFVAATAAFAGTNASGTINSTGISVSVGNYITTGMLSNAATISNIRLSAGTTSNLASAFTFSNSNGISFGLNAGTITGSHNALTTAMASNRGSDFVQATAAFAGTNASGTIASGGISVSVGNYITTGMLSNAATISNIRVSAGTTSNLLSAITFSNANGISFGLDASTVTAQHNAITTGALSNHSHGVSFTSGSVGFQTLSFTNSNGISFNSGTQGIFGSHNAITTGRASTDALGLATAQTNVTWTANSAGVSLNAAGYAGTETTFNGANMSGSMTQNSNGLQLSLSVAAPGAAAENNWIHLLGANTAGNTTVSGSTLGFSGINITFSGTNASQLVASVGAYITTGALSDHSHGNPTLNLTNISGTTASNSAGLTLSLSAGPIGTFTQRYQWPPGNLTAVAAMGNGSFSINRFQADDNISATLLGVPFLVSLASSAAANTWGLAVTAFGAIYTKNVSTLSSLSSGSTAWSISLASNTAGTTQVIAHAIRPVSIPMNVNMSIGEYYVGFGISTNTSSVGTATTALGNTWSVMGGPIYSSAVGQVGNFTEATNTSTGLFGGQGVYSAAISTVPPTVSLSAINQTGSYYARGNIGLIFRNI